MFEFNPDLMTGDDDDDGDAEAGVYTREKEEDVSVMFVSAVGTLQLFFCDCEKPQILLFFQII